MNVADMLKQTGALDSISRELGISQQQAQTGAAALMPALLGGFRKEAQREAASAQSTAAPGSSGLLGLLGNLGGGKLLNEVTSQNPTPREPGNEILGQVFGSKEVSRTVANQAAQSTGLDPSMLKKMLPLLAMAVSGYMLSRGGGAAQQQSSASSGGIGGLLGQVMGGGGAQRRNQAASSGGLGGLLSMLDMDRDGNPLDDIMRMMGKFGR